MKKFLWKSAVTLYWFTMSGMLLILFTMICTAVLSGCKEKDPEWADKMSANWAESLGMKATHTNCLTYTANYAKCSVRVNNDAMPVYSLECIRRDNKCVGIGK